MQKFTIYINSENKMIEKPLPAENNRRLTLDISDAVQKINIELEVFDNVWTILSNENYSLSVNDENISSHIIADGDVIKGITCDGRRFVLLVYAVNENITNFARFDISNADIITIGKGEDCDIIIDSPFISARHAVIEKSKDGYIFRDQSLNGSYINGDRAKGEHRLNIMDIISAVGIKLVFLGNCIAINRSDIVNSRFSLSTESSDIERHENGDEFFSRSPRIVEPLFDEVIEIEAPPVQNKQRNQPLIFVIGPSVTMPIPILLSIFINSQMNSTGNSYLSMIASVGMSAIVGTSWALAHYVYNRKTLEKDEKTRVDAYKEYIRKNEELIKEKQNYDNSVLINQFLSLYDIAAKIDSSNSFVWNRNINHEDFLRIRIGTGDVNFEKHIAVPKQRFSLSNDEMAELPHKLFEKYKYIHSAVVTYDLKNTGLIGILGEHNHISEVARNIILQTAVLHCYTDVRIAVFFNENEQNDYSCLRWLPHVYSEDMKLRMISCKPEERKNVLYHICSVLKLRAECLDKEIFSESFHPHYIVYCTDKSIFDGESIEKYIPMAEKLAFTFILAYQRIDLLPNECYNIIQCDDDYTGMYDLKGKRDNTNRIDADKIDLPTSDMLAKALSSLKVREYSVGEIPSSIDYFSMLGIGKLEQWDLIKKYKENRVYEGIRSFVGIGSGGKPMIIDIHEKKHGPHGLVAGTTGSGKSETLQSFILSLALNYHPDEISFILIDYKGGGMAFAFKGMPHIAGMITNIGDVEDEIDSNVTRRALISIRSEIKRRQTIFSKFKVNHIDSYIRLYREGKSDEPLPHLVIIADEFAELKREQPEFIKELVSTARVGRSLGIHLILATQKPNGVIDEEIWSNSRFKICLRVQDKQDSNDMLKRPDAAYLTQTGRAFFQLGNDELFEQFQTGYSGADYCPCDNVGEASEKNIYMMNMDGTQAISGIQRSSDKNAVKQLKAAADYITTVCKDNHISSARALWLDELPTKILLDDIETGYVGQESIKAVFGLIDDPEKQEQFAAEISLSDVSNLLISGISGIGKSTLIQTILVSLIKNYTCEQFVYYILDFSSRTLKVFNKSRHCGLVAFSEEDEAVERLFAYTEAEMERRKKLFDAVNVGSYTEYIRIKKLPLQLVVLDDFFKFNELYPELYDKFVSITRDCSKYGIQVIMTCCNMNEVKYKLRQNFGSSIALLAAEKADYRDIYGMTADFLPKNIKGRGLIPSNGRLLEYQVALPCGGENEAERHTVLEDIINKINIQNAEYQPAERIKIIQKEQSYEDFAREYISDKVLPIGYNIENISAYGINYAGTFCYAVSDTGTKGLSLVLGNILKGAELSGIKSYVIKLKNNIRFNTGSALNVCRDIKSVSEMILSFKDDFNARAKAKKQYLIENPDGDFASYISERFEKHILIIDSMNEFLELLRDPSDKMQASSFFEEYLKNGFGMGIYFIAGFDTSIYASNYYQPICKSFVDYRKGIHLGGRLDKQKIVEVNMSISLKSKPDEYFKGITVDNDIEMHIFVPKGEEEV